MKKNRYRIEINHKRNGEKYYRAHVDMSRGFFKWSKLGFLINTKNNIDWYDFDTISDVEKAIQNHIEQDNKNYMEEVINVEYKYL